MRDWRWGTSRAALAGASMLAGLLLFEAGFRVIQGSADPVPSDTPWEFCEDRHHRLLPRARTLHESYEFRYLWENNSLGMRDRERAEKPPPGTFRILILGDSFVQGHGVAFEDTFAQVLERRWARMEGVTIEVVNAGVFGYSPLLEYLYLRQIIDRMEPDLVLLGMFLGNDVGEDLFYARQAEGDPIAGAGSASSPWSPSGGGTPATTSAS